MDPLFDFLGFQNPAPFYGRHHTEITVGWFSGQDSCKFLADGPRQIGAQAPKGILTRAVQKLDGVAGRLTSFCARRRERKACSKDIANVVALEAGKLSRQEAERRASVSPSYCVALN